MQTGHSVATPANNLQVAMGKHKIINNNNTGAVNVTGMTFRLQS